MHSNQMIIKFSYPLDNDYKFQKIGKVIFDVAISPTLNFLFHFSYPRSQYSTKVSFPISYCLSQLPTLLQVDSIIKFDRSQIMRWNFLHYNVDELLRQEVPRQDSISIFYDPQGQGHIFLQNIKNHQTYLPYRNAQSFTANEWKEMTPEDWGKIKYSAHPLLVKYLGLRELQNWANLKVVTLDQIRCKCLANIYMDPEEIIKQVYKVITWNQIYRTKSANSFIYLNILLENITSIINKKKFHKRFAHIKNRDFQRLLSYQIKYKINVSQWPYVPSKFRQYQEIDHYAPTPEKRSQFVEKRLLTKKKPVQCLQNCSCYAQPTNSQQPFCKHSLKDGWITSCPNRSNKIECSHSDPQKMKRCRNAQIKKCERKKCKINENDDNPENEIQQCIMWGMDLHTRNTIYYSLPEVDVEFNSFTDNKQYKNQFIEETLSKAINFNLNEGYDLRKACQLIINDYREGQQNSQDKNNVTCIQSQQGSIKCDWEFSSLHYKIPKEGEKMEETNKQQTAKKQGQLFTQKDRYYAQNLLKNYEYCYNCVDKTAFRIHTKGKGARCISKNGIKQGSFIVQYYGQLYEPWRWYERQDFIKQIMKKKKLKNYIPQFYNIYLQHHKDDPEGYDLMVVDPNKKGNFSSRFSHSCNPNCGTVTTISDGKYYIGMYCFRDIKYGEELTFDYCCMTQSNYQHLHSICLCGTQKCRGNYLQLANSRTFSQLVDKNTCFLSRNSLILQALQPITQQDIQLCSQFNIKDRMLADAPNWIKKWTAKLLKFIESQSQMYKQQLKKKWSEQYPWQPTNPLTQQANIELYSQTSKNDLLGLRFQNLFTTVDKMKYFLNCSSVNSELQGKDPPLYYLNDEQLVGFMINNKESILKQIEEVMIENERSNQAFLIKKFKDIIHATQDMHIKMFYFRLCCLCVSHMCMFIQPTKRFNSHLLADIVYFYAFTHTYFTAKQYKPQVSEELKVSLMQITGKPTDAKNVEKQKRRYNSQFVWGQLVSWYKQTIVNPQASLSQDRRGTLSYPMIKSTVNSCYPFQKHCRPSFLKALREKSANSWPCAPDHGCLLSFKNPFKCYGTVFFENVHNFSKFTDLPKKNLLDNVLDKINSNFEQKLQLFKKVEAILSNVGQFHQAYEVLTHISVKYFSFSQSIPEVAEEIEESKAKKKRKQEMVVS